jgi:hypothetical protein
MHPLAWSDHTLQVLTAIGTVGAVGVAVLAGLFRRFFEWRRERRTRPDLLLRYDGDRDLTVETVVLPVQMPDGSEQELRLPALYARLRVENSLRRRAATGVEVIVAEIDPVTPSPSLSAAAWRAETIRSYSPLGWTHTEPPALTLGPGALRTVDLGMVIDHAAAPEFRVGLQVSPASGVDALPPGRYAVLLRVTAANVDAQRWALTLDYDGRWVKGQTPSDHLKLTNLHRVD